MLRTPAPFIGALGVSLKRALAMLARNACGFQIEVCSRLSLVLEGRGLVCAEVRACVLALPSGSIRAWLAPCPMAVPRSLLALAGVLLGPVKRRFLLSFLLPELRGLGSAVFWACVFALASGSTKAWPVPSPRKGRSEPEACFGVREALQNPKLSSGLRHATEQ